MQVVEIYIDNDSFCFVTIMVGYCLLLTLTKGQKQCLAKHDKVMSLRNVKLKEQGNELTLAPLQKPINFMSDQLNDQKRPV